MSKLPIAKGKMFQGLTKRFWQRLDNPIQASEIFVRVRAIMTQLRFGRFMHEYDVRLTDEEALVDLRSKLSDFVESYGKVEEEVMVAKYRIVPWGEGVSCEVFGWFASKGEEARRFFEEQHYDPDSFVSQEDIDFAKRLSEENLWDDTRKVYRSHTFS